MRWRYHMKTVCTDSSVFLRADLPSPPSPKQFRSWPFAGFSNSRLTLTVARTMHDALCSLQMKQPRQISSPSQTKELSQRHGPRTQVQLHSLQSHCPKPDTPEHFSLTTACWGEERSTGAARRLKPAPSAWPPRSVPAPHVPGELQQPCHALAALPPLCQPRGARTRSSSLQPPPQRASQELSCQATAFITVPLAPFWCWCSRTTYCYQLTAATFFKKRATCWICHCSSSPPHLSGRTEQASALVFSSFCCNS